MNVDCINPVLSSMLNVLSTMAQLDAKPSKPRLKTGTEALGDVSGMIDMKGEGVNGSLAISFSTQVIGELCKRMLRHEIDGIDDTAKDLTGEMTNMVTGGAKSGLEEKGYNISMSLPRVSAGDKHVLEHPVDAKTVVLPFTSEAGEFYVEICFE